MSGKYTEYKYIIIIIITRETVLDKFDKFAGCELMFTASKNAALDVFHNHNLSNLDSSDQQIRF